MLKLFDSVKEQYHQSGVDNLYISAKFFKDAYQHPKCTLLYGVAQNHVMCLPQFFIQDGKKERLNTGERYSKRCKINR